MTTYTNNLNNNIPASAANSWLNALYPISFGRLLHNDCFEMSAHTHINMEILYVLSGVVELIYSGGESVFLKSNQFAIISPNIEHRLKVQSDNIEIMVLELLHNGGKSPVDKFIREESVFAQYPSARKLFAPDRVIFFNDTSQVKTTMESLLDLLKTRAEQIAQEFFELGYEILTKQLIMSICQCRTSHLDISDNRHINKILSYIREKYAENITVGEIAKYAGLTPSYAQKLLQAATGKTVKGIINHYRIRQAEELLTSTSLPLNVVAEKTGFATLNNMYRAFIKEHGCPPSDYRASYRRKTYQYF